MIITRIPLSQLKKPKRNPRIHSEKQIKELVKSLEANEQIRPIVVDEDYTILCGNGLYDALLAKGETEADCLVKKGMTENEKKKLMLSDNKIYSLGVDDMSVFEEFLAELGDDLDIPGYEKELREALTADSSDIDDMMSGYGIISNEMKEQIETTAKKYEADDTAYANEAEEIKPAQIADETPEPEKLDRRYIVCPKCGERIWI